MKTQKDVVLMSEQKRIRTGERVFREVEMFWAVVIVMVGLIVLFAEKPTLPDGRGEARLASMSRPVRTNPTGLAQVRHKNPLIHLTASDSDE